MATIGNLVVNLQANAKPFSKGLKSASGSLKSFASTALKVAGPLAAVFGGKAAWDAARTQEQAQKKLAATLAATGGAAGLSQKEIQDYASELQSMTNIGDDTTIAAAGVLATFKNLSGDVFKDALSMAQDMSQVMGTDMQGSIVQLGKALNDPTKGLAALADVGVTFTEQQKEQVRALQASGDLLGAQTVILDELKSEFGGAAAAMADPFTQLSNDIGDVGEQLGFMLRNGFRPIAEWAKTWMPHIQSMFSALGDIASEVGDSISAMFAGAGTTAGDAVIELTDYLTDLFRQVAVWLHVLTENWDVAWELMVTSTALQLVKMWDNIKTTFKWMGELAWWIWEQMKGAFMAIGDFVGTVFANVMNNAKAALEFAKEAASNPLEAAEAYKKALNKMSSLTEGFQGFELKGLKFSDAIVSDTQTDLANDVAELGGQLGDAFNEEFARRYAETTADAGEQVNQAGQSVAARQAASSKLAGAMEAGTAEAYSLIMQSQKGNELKAQESTAQNTETIAGEVAQTNQILRSQLNFNVAGAAG